MAGFSCGSTKRTSYWPAPMSWEAPPRFRVSVVVAALALTGCNASQEVNPSSRTAPGVVAGAGLQSLQSYQLRTEQHREPQRWPLIHADD